MHLFRIRSDTPEFYAQFCAVMQEFGDQIPWLEQQWWSSLPVFDVRFADLFAHRMQPRCGKITAYGLIDDGRGAVIGGIYHCTMSPECFGDRRNVTVAERLVTEGAGYIGCLYIVKEHRGHGVGTDMMRDALACIVPTHGAVWGVAPSIRLRDWYVTLGAQSCSPEENADNLWIVHWPIP